MVGSGNKSTGDSDLALDGFTKDLRERADQAVLECQKIKSELQRQMRELDAKVSSKVNREELNVLDDSLSKGLDSLMSTSYKKFLEKNDFNRVLKDIDI